jgi:hypothetical protein
VDAPHLDAFDLIPAAHALPAVRDHRDLMASAPQLACKLACHLLDPADFREVRVRHEEDPH